MVTLEREPTILRVVGVIISFLGVVWYSVFKLYDKPKAKTADASSDDKSAPLNKPTEGAPLIKK